MIPGRTTCGANDEPDQWFLSKSTHSAGCRLRRCDCIRSRECDNDHGISSPVMFDYLDSLLHMRRVRAFWWRRGLRLVYPWQSGAERLTTNSTRGIELSP